MLLKDIPLQFTLGRRGYDKAVEQGGGEPGWQDKAAVWLARSAGGQRGPQSHVRELRGGPWEPQRAAGGRFLVVSDLGQLRVRATGKLGTVFYL